MVRSHEDEMMHRRKLRTKYFEDPSYRKWSDVVPDGFDGGYYSGWRDDVLFSTLITNQSTGRQTASQLIEYLDKGHELPINWVNFYAYFDEQLNDPENRYLSSILDNDIRGDEFEWSTSVVKLLNRYREQLCSSYDII